MSLATSTGVAVAVAGADAVPGTAPAPVVDGAVVLGGPGTAAGGLGGSSDDGASDITSDDGAPDITHHNTKAINPATINLIKSMVSSTNAQ